MKTVFWAIVLVLVLVVQVFFMQGWQVSGVTPNLLIGFIVMSCLFLDSERMLWIGFFAGMFLELYSNSDFGLSLGFYILLVLVCKFILHFGEREYSWWKPALVAGVAAIIQALILQFTSLLSGINWAIISQVGLYGLYCFIIAGAWYLILGQLSELTENINLRGMLKK